MSHVFIGQIQVQTIPIAQMLNDYASMTLALIVTRLWLNNDSNLNLNLFEND